MINKASTLVYSIVLALTLQTLAQAQIIVSVDFSGTSTQPLTSTDTAGASPYAATNWNVVTGAGTSTPVGLNDSTGASTTLTLDSISSPSGPSPSLDGLGGSPTPTTGDLKLYDGFNTEDGTYGWGPITFTISNLNAYSSYSLVVYTETQDYGTHTRTGNISTSQAGSPTYYLINQGASPSPYTQITSTDSSSPTLGNYAVFSGLTDSSLTVYYTPTSNVSGVTAFQIIGISPVPEPSSWVMLFGSIALLACFRRSRHRTV